MHALSQLALYVLWKQMSLRLTPKKHRFLKPVALHKSLSPKDEVRRLWWSWIKSSVVWGENLKQHSSFQGMQGSRRDTQWNSMALRQIWGKNETISYSHVELLPQDAMAVLLWPRFKRGIIHRRTRVVLSQMWQEWPVPQGIEFLKIAAKFLGKEKD